MYIYEKGDKVVSQADKYDWFSTRTVILYIGGKLKFEYVKDAGTHSGEDST